MARACPADALSACAPATNAPARARACCPGCSCLGRPCYAPGARPVQAARQAHPHQGTRADYFDDVLAVLGHADDRRLVGVVAGGLAGAVVGLAELEGAGGAGPHRRQRVAQCRAVLGQVAADLGVLQGLGDDVHGVVRLGRELVGRAVELGLVGVDELHALGRLVLDGPGAADPQVVRRAAGSQVEDLDRVHAVAADDRQVDAELAGLHHDRGAFGQQGRQHDGVGVGALDLGQLGLEVNVALGEGLGRVTGIFWSSRAFLKLS